MPVRHVYDVYPYVFQKDWPTVVTLPLGTICSLPRDCALVLVSCSSPDTSTRNFYVSDMYNEFADAGNTDATTCGWYSSCTNSYVWFRWIHFGPTPNSNPDKYVRVAATKYYVNIFTQWYYTYDEVEIFPELLTQAGRDTLRLSPYYRPTIGGVGWNGSWRDSTVNELAPGHSPSSGDPRSALILRTDYRTSTYGWGQSGMRIAPRSALYRNLYSLVGEEYPYIDNDTMMPVRSDMAHNLSVWCSNTSDTNAYVEPIGLLKTPMRWTGTEGPPVQAPKTFGNRHWENRYLRAAPDEDGMFFNFKYNLSTGVEPKGNGRTPNARTNKCGYSQICPTGVDNEVWWYMYRYQSPRGQVWVWGHTLKQKVETVEPCYPGELQLEHPALYYTPDNFGSVVLAYSVDNASAAFAAASALKFYLSGGAGNSDPNASLGGVRSTTELTSAENSLFDDAATLEVYVGLTTYRCLYVKNTAAQTAVGIKIWVNKDNLASSFIRVGSDPAGIGGTAQTIASEAVTPTTAGEMVPLSESGGFTIPMLAAGQEIALWFGREFVPRGTQVLTPDPVTLNVSVLDM